MTAVAPEVNLIHCSRGREIEIDKQAATGPASPLRAFAIVTPPPPCTAPVLTVWESGVFQYDFAGNIIAIGGDAFSYDRLSRLKTATINRHPHDTFATGPQPAGSVSLAYAYDIFGNITQRTLAASQNYTVGSDPALELFSGRGYAASVNAVPDNKIHQVGFLYDGNGNLISDGKKDFVYDELNEQVEVHEVVLCPFANCYGKGPLIEANLYGPDGMRATRHVEKMVGTARTATDTVYVRLGGSVVKEYTEELRTATSPAPEISHEKAYVYGPLGLLATEELCSFNCKSDESAGLNTTRYYEYDHLGTIRAITDSTGKLTATFDYEPFGLELKSASFDWWSDASSNTHKFTGHERDDEAGEDYMKARMYVLSTARFPQIDPMMGGIGNPQNWNAYIYVMNSPVGSSDPTGELPNSNAEFHIEGSKGPTSAFDSATIEMNTSPAIAASAPGGTGSTSPPPTPPPTTTQEVTGTGVVTSSAPPAASAGGTPGTDISGSATNENQLNADKSFLSSNICVPYPGGNQELNNFTNATGFYDVQAGIVNQQEGKSDKRELAVGLAVVTDKSGNNTIVYQKGIVGTINSAPAKPSSFSLYNAAALGGGDFAISHNHFSENGYNPRPSGVATTGTSGDIEFSPQENTIVFAASRQGLYAAMPGGQCYRLAGPGWMGRMASTIDQLQQYQYSSLNKQTYR